MSFGHTEIAYMQFYQRAHDSSMAKGSLPCTRRSYQNVMSIGKSLMWTFVNIVTSSSIKNEFGWDRSHNEPVSKILMEMPWRETRAGDSDHFKNTTASQLVHNKVLFKNVGELYPVGFYASYKVRCCIIQSLHQLIQLTLHFSKDQNHRCYHTALQNEFSKC